MLDNIAFLIVVRSFERAISTSATPPAALSADFGFMLGEVA
ncbi:MAG TPA: hypothetical protein VNJ10_14500 [Sphingomonas sp.]|nr:hypothetical protein [Sphingomonas sp.]